jgi:UDP-GlcNAc:undecaprenyl-phosphate GlcNAc-1-phosphate transferase
MIALLCILGASCLLCLALVPAVRVLAARYGLVDRPDGRRKIHSRAVPLAGGLAILAAACATLGAALVVPHDLQEPLLEQVPFLVGLLASVVILCAVGVADDLGRLRGRHKLIGQCVAVGVLIGSGVLVHSIQLFGWRIDLGLLAVPFTAFLLLGAINSLNLIDGMDGLLGSVGGIICLALAAMAALAGHWAMAAVAAALAGGLLGFLRYNFPPASIFLGDAGSMMVGLVVGTLAIQSSLKAPATIALAMPVVLLTLPILDTSAAILRRKLTGRSIYATDRGHLHHCLLRSGLSVRGVLLLVSVICIATGLSVLASQAFNTEWIALITGLAVIAILVVTRLFGYAEVVLVKERLLAFGRVLFTPTARGQPRQLVVRLQGTADWKQLWTMLTAAAEQYNLKQLCLDVNAPALHEGFHARWDHAHDDGEVPSLWRAAMPITAAGSIVGRLEIAGVPDAQPVWAKIAAVTRVVDDFENIVASLACGSSPAAAVLVPEPAA